MRIHLEEVCSVLSVMPHTQQVLRKRQVIKLLKEKPFYLEGREGPASHQKPLVLHTCLAGSLLCTPSWVILCLHHKSTAQCFSSLTVHTSPGEHDEKYRILGPPSRVSDSIWFCGGVQKAAFLPQLFLVPRQDSGPLC